MTTTEATRVETAAHGTSTWTATRLVAEREIRSYLRMKGFWIGGPYAVARNIWHTLYFLCSLSMCGLGMYAACQGTCSLRLCVALLTYVDRLDQRFQE